MKPRETTSHPSSELLALCVLRPEEAFEIDRNDLHEHLQVCSACREDVALAREAVHAARPRKQASPSPRLPKRLVAAALVIFAITLGFLLASDRQPFHAILDSTQQLSGRDLEGAQDIRGETSLVVSKVTVRQGADVTFHAGKVVAFGDGFQVAKGARIRVGSGQEN